MEEQSLPKVNGTSYGGVQGKQFIITKLMYEYFTNMIVNYLF